MEQLHLSAEPVLHFFRELCAIPHGSGHTKAISDYCVQFAQKRGLRVIQEPCNNVIIFQDATPGYEQHPAVMVQGHLDMVCEKEPDCPLNMERDGLQLREDGEWLLAEGTTLGADDGIAVACALALLDAPALRHPPLEVVFTVDEETGMDGACELDAAPLRARILLNMDSEEEGVLTVGCAGGCTAELRWNGVREPVEGSVWMLEVGGLQGGHSGTDIGKGKANADILLGRALARLSGVRLLSVNGGTKGNAIPRSAQAVFAVPIPQTDAVAAELEREFRADYADTEPGLFLRLQPAVGAEPAFSAELSARVIELLSTQLNGVQTMSDEIPGLVQTSLNLGILESDEHGITEIVSLRSSVGAEKEALKQQLAHKAAEYGAEVRFSGEYPAWEYCRASRLRDVMSRSYEELYGQKPRVETIHAGLECGLLSAKLPGLDAVSFGPDILDIHTTRERLNIPSAARTWTLLCRVLEQL